MARQTFFFVAGEVMAILKEERIGGQRLILGDCLQVMPLLGKFDAVVTDPPYGIGAAKMSLGKWVSSRLSKKEWDAKTPDLSFLPSVPSIVWGGNYFPLPPARAFLVWDKGAGFKGRDFAECEMAWCSFDANARIFSYDPLAKGDYRRRVHKTQKPVALMEWCLGFLPKAQTILDPFMGSGTTLVACQKLGRNGTGIELDPDYFDIACKRVDEATRQVDLFIAPPPPQATQEGFDI